jgi:hypothetical protein
MVNTLRFSWTTSFLYIIIRRNLRFRPPYDTLAPASRLLQGASLFDSVSRAGWVRPLRAFEGDRGCDDPVCGALLGRLCKTRLIILNLFMRTNDHPAGPAFLIRFPRRKRGNLRGIRQPARAGKRIKTPGRCLSL